MDLNKIKKRLFLSLIIAIIVFAGLSMYSDFQGLIDVFTDFDYGYLPFILMLAPLNYLFRYMKWCYYLDLIHVSINRRDNFFIFLSGLSMTITPGKVGELLKSYLLKEKSNTPISSTAPLIMAERLTDGISMVLLASVGSMAYNYGKNVLFVVLLGLFLFMGIVQSPKLVYTILKIMGRIPFLHRFLRSMENFYEKSYIVLRLKPLILAISIGVVSWFFEGVVLFLTSKALGFDLSLLASIFIVSFSSIVGAVSMMPGGLFAAEGSILGLLIMMDMPKDMGVAATLVTRFSTLWLGVVIGLLGLIVVQKTIIGGDHHEKES